MVFTHDTEVALAGAAALVNTLDGERELLPDPATLDEFVRAWGWTGERDHDDPELQAVRNLRLRLRRLWDVDEEGVVHLVNKLLREANALPQLVKHDQWDYHLHATHPRHRCHPDGGRGGDGIRRCRPRQGAEPAAALRRPRLPQRCRRSVEEPLEALL